MKIQQSQLQLYKVASIKISLLYTIFISAEVQKMLMYTSTPPYAFMAECLIS
jgi:hypothetical protein